MKTFNNLQDLSKIRSQFSEGENKSSDQKTIKLKTKEQVKIDNESFEKDGRTIKYRR